MMPMHANGRRRDAADRSRADRAARPAGSTKPGSASTSPRSGRTSPPRHLHRRRVAADQPHQAGHGVSCLPNHNPFHLAHRLPCWTTWRGTLSVGHRLGWLRATSKSSASTRAAAHAAKSRSRSWTRSGIVVGPGPGQYATNDGASACRFDPRIAKHVYLKPFQRRTAHRRARRDGKIGDPRAGGRARLDSDEHQLRDARVRGRWRASSTAASAAARCQPRRLAHRPRRPRCRNRAEARRRISMLGRDYGTYFLPLLVAWAAAWGGQADRGHGRIGHHPRLSVRQRLDRRQPRNGRPQGHLYASRSAVSARSSSARYDWPDPAIWDRSMTLFASAVAPRLADWAVSGGVR